MLMCRLHHESISGTNFVSHAHHQPPHALADVGGLVAARQPPSYRRTPYRPSGLEVRQRFEESEYFEVEEDTVNGPVLSKRKRSTRSKEFSSSNRKPHLRSKSLPLEPVPVEKDIPISEGIGKPFNDSVHSCDTAVMKRHCFYLQQMIGQHFIFDTIFPQSD